VCASGGRLLHEVVQCGPLESLGLLNHLLMLCSLSRYCSLGGLLPVWVFASGICS
jgi:hypothetical protein